MSITTYTSPLYLADDIEELIESRYSDNPEIKKILTGFARELEVIHSFTRKLVDFENGLLDNSQLKGEYNLHKVAIGKITLGDII